MFIYILNAQQQPHNLLYSGLAVCSDKAGLKAACFEQCCPHHPFLMGMSGKKKLMQIISLCIFLFSLSFLGAGDFRLPGKCCHQTVQKMAYILGLLPHSNERGRVMEKPSLCLGPKSVPAEEMKTKRTYF